MTITKPNVLGVKWNGQQYRSRVEARWAMLFAKTNTAALYEPEAYQLSGGECYLPDFWLPEFKLFVEIKADDPTEDERRKCRELAKTTGKPVALMHGQPNWHFGELFGVLSHGNSDARLSEVKTKSARFVLMQDWGRTTMGKLYLIAIGQSDQSYFSTELDRLDRVTDYDRESACQWGVEWPKDQEIKTEIMKTLFWNPR